ncbi:phospholipase A and acyltransferase 3-like [Ruditapes philippinarum]|uniref:phospholipase A and acyltransferase 3-like n=1 Tax=Ruditapes philippinarum TaxID=129788 RepID=UPI00295BDB2B|nr:phospholipase A and acyltransferase 3-like [Ruditapes philippinarum]
MPLLFEREIAICDLEEGDLIEFYRAWGTYSHWAVYIGNQTVIHLSPNPDAMGKFNLKNMKRGTSVRKDNIKTAARYSKTYRNNEFDNEHEPLSKSEIVGRATEQLGSHGYNLATYNCEHFATECRYGVARSKQAEAVVERAVTGIRELLELRRKYSWIEIINLILKKVNKYFYLHKSIERVKL